MKSNEQHKQREHMIKCLPSLHNRHSHSICSYLKGFAPAAIPSCGKLQCRTCYLELNFEVGVVCDMSGHLGAQKFGNTIRQGGIDVVLGVPLSVIPRGESPNEIQRLGLKFHSLVPPQGGLAGFFGRCAECLPLV